MKTQIITTVTAVLLIMFTVSAYAQSKEDCMRLLKKNECTQAEIDAAKAKKQQLENQISNQISQGVEKKGNELKNSDSELGLNYRRSQMAYNPDATPEQLMQAAGLVRGKDYKTEMEGLNNKITITSNRGKEVFTEAVSNATKYFNDNIEDFKKVAKEHNDLLNSYKTDLARAKDEAAKEKVRSDYSKIKNEYDTRKDKLYNSLDNAKKYLNTLFINTSEQDKESRDKLINAYNLINNTRTTLYKNPDKVERIKDFGDLKDIYLKDCKDCGQKQ